MKHRIKHNQLGRNTNQAKALYRGLIQSLIESGRIETTLAKAKAVIGDVDHVVTIAKRNDVNARRQLIKLLGSDFILEKLFLAVKSMNGRNSGYTRIIRLENRGSDNAKLAILELVDQSSVPAIASPTPAAENKSESENKPSEPGQRKVEATTKIKKTVAKKAPVKKTAKK